MALNDKYFVPPEATQTLLRVRGFGQDDKRSGGLVSPQIVDLPGGTVLFRMYHDPTRDYGEWWATPRELAVIAELFRARRAGLRRRPLQRQGHSPCHHGGAARLG